MFDVLFDYDSTCDCIIALTRQVHQTQAGRHADQEEMVAEMVQSELDSTPRSASRRLRGGVISCC